MVAVALLLLAQSHVSLELEALAKADQAARQADWTKLTAEQHSKIAAADRARRARVREILQAGGLSSDRDFDRAALIFQHGEQPDDFLTAHELYFLSLIKGGFSNGLAISEDRLLEHLGRKQRLGTQFDLTGSILKPVVEDSPAAATDTHRLDFFTPSLALSREKGGTALMDIVEQVQERISSRMKKDFIATKEMRPDAKRLAEYAARGGGVEWTLALYAKDGILTPKDYLNAARILLKSQDPETLMLAHEFACQAAFRKEPEGTKLFAETMDRFLVNIGRNQRYGTVGGKVNSNVTLTVRRELGLNSSHK
jgi:hypothetical protein